jgi:glycosyltransferase involved in cell wall biosynthesis
VTKNNSIAFVIHNLVLYETVEPLIKECEKRQILYDIYVPRIEQDDWKDMSLDTYNYLKDIGVNVILTDSVPDENYKIAFYPYLPYYLEVKADYKFRYQYGMAKPNWNLDSWSRNFDFIFCNSLYDIAVLKAYTQTEIVGMIKYAEFKRNKEQGDKYNLLYLPTYGKESSIELVTERIKELSETFNVTVKLHHGTSFLESDRVRLIRSVIPDVLDHRTPLVKLIEKADVILSDGSGAIFDALYTETPIVIFHHTKTESFEGILPLEEQIIEKKIVTYVSLNDNLKERLLEAISDDKMIEIRSNFTNEMFPVRGRETIDRCFQIINKFLNDDVDQGYLAGHNRLLKEFNKIESELSSLRYKNNVTEEENQKKQYLIEEQQLQLNNNIEFINDLTQNNEILNSKVKKISADNANLQLYIAEVSEKAQNEYALLDKEYKELLNKLKEIEGFNERLLTELNNIYQSKRWKLANKIRGLLYITKMNYISKSYKILKKYGMKILFLKVKNKIIYKFKRTTLIEDTIDKRKDAQHSDSILNWYEYKFMNYKINKDKSFNLQLSKFEINNEKDLISIVLPVFNGEDYISKAIDSVLNQTYKKFELIIINDGSKDKTAEIIDSYADSDSRIQVIHQENRKIPRTLSRGFKIAKGEFCTWTSADNIIPHNFLEIMVSELKKDEDIGMVYANMRLIDSNDAVIPNHGWYEEPKSSGNVILPSSTLELNVYPNNTIGAAFMYRAKVAKILGDYSSYKHTLEDYDYWMRVNSLFDLRHVSFDEPIYDYRWHDKSLTALDQELGITLNRYKLMALDDFRRDFYLTPLLWIIDGDSAEEVEMLGDYVDGKGHLVLRKEEFINIKGINRATPICYIYIQSNARPFSTDNINGFANVHKLLIDKSDENAIIFKDIWDCTIGFKKSGSINMNYDFFVQDNEVLFSLINTKVKNDHLYQIEAEIESEQVFDKELTVVLCTYQRSSKLVNSIKSVIEQTLDKESYEIIIVNNDFRNDEIRSLIDDLRSVYGVDDAYLRYVEAPLKGLSFARNVGLFAAKGQIILYIDDDAIASGNLLEETINGFRDRPDIGVFGGNIILNFQEGVPEVVRPGTEAYWSQLVVEGDEITESRYQWEFPYGANFAVRKEALMRIGGFRSAYGRKGNDYAGGEEIVVSYSMKEIGFKVGLNPKMRVIHDVDASRYTVEHVEKTMLNSIMTNYQLQKDLYAPMDSDIEADKGHLEVVEAELSHLQSSPSISNEIDILYKKYTINAYKELIRVKEMDTKMRKEYAGR